MELSGSVPDLPPGYSFSPGLIVNSTDPKMKNIEVSTNTLSTIFPLSEEEYLKIKIPEGTSEIAPRIIQAFTSDPRRIPYGFLASSPHRGYDPDRLDKSRLKYISEIDSGMKSSKVNIPRGHTTKRVPVLWPTKEV
jgi:hypothetical protein